jgi:hypothetical protein
MHGEDISFDTNFYEAYKKNISELVCCQRRKSSAAMLWFSSVAFKVLQRNYYYGSFL